MLSPLVDNRVCGGSDALFSGPSRTGRKAPPPISEQPGWIARQDPDSPLVHVRSDIDSIVQSRAQLSMSIDRRNIS